MIRILHMSDIHFKNTDEEKNIIGKLCEDIKQKNWNIDLFIISGDLLNCGGKGFEDIDFAFLEFGCNFIDRLKKNLNIEEDRIFICPGNHDIDQNLVNKYVNKLINKELNKGQDSINEFMDNAYNEFENIERIKSYKDFENIFYQNYENKYISNFESSFKLKIKDKSIGISSLNTCWRCCKEKEDEDLFLGKKQLENSYKFIKDCDIKIAIMHHSYEFLNEIERKVIKNAIQRDYDYLFLGHVHNMDSYNIQSLNGGIFTSIAQSHSIDNENSIDVNYAMGYSIIEINEEEGKINFYNRRYVEKRNEYVNNVDLLGDEGKKVYNLLTNEEKQYNENIKNIVGKISENYVSELDKHLLSYKTDSNAPKTINDIFVHPKIIEKNNYDIDERYDLNKTKEEKVYFLEDIIKEESNILIVGDKEVGKTILLDKIAIELVDNFDIYRNIPIKIDFKNCGKIDKDIAKYLGIKYSDLESFIDNNKIILIIDNLDFSDEWKKQVVDLEKVVDKYKNIKIICSCRTNIEKELPVEVISNNVFNKFLHLYLNSWDSNQIEELINIWFINSEDKGLRVQDITNIFNNIKMPLTPLNVSMFLWVIEHQTNYKLINTSELMDVFLTHLLEKLDLSSLYHDSFDYANKITLLADISHKMFETGKYSMTYDDLYKYISSYFKRKKLKVKIRTEKIIEYFIDKGILIEQNQNEEIIIAFRFECFFRFFLMKYMHNESFKNFVIDEKNYLNFTNEIVYYTGLSRKEEELLEVFHKRMIKEFKTAKDFLDDLGINYDNYFEISKPLVENIQIDDIFSMKKEDKEIKQNMAKKNDRIIESLNEDVKEGHINTKDNNENTINRLYAVWTLVAQVLRNSEEIENGELKNKIYKDVIECSIIFLIVYKIFIDGAINMLLEEGKEQEFNKFFRDLKITSRILPALHQNLLSKLLGTIKLEIVLEEETEKVFEESSSSDLEKFMNSFVLFNVNKLSGINFINKLIRYSKKNYIKDMVFLEIMRCYKSSEIDANLDNKYLNIMGEIKKEDDKVKQGLKLNKQKGNFISQLKNKKLLEVNLQR